MHRYHCQSETKGGKMRQKRAHIWHKQGHICEYLANGASGKFQT